VEFNLEEVPGGTKLTVTESGFDNIPLARRAEAFRMNSEGWAQQLRNIEAHVAGA
ncbi:MAG: vanillate O-demethylase oxidoreductase VanB, partial [Chloroflexi bacterium]